MLALLLDRVIFSPAKPEVPALTLIGLPMLARTIRLPPDVTDTPLPSPLLKVLLVLLPP